jgi:hypothetical protein
MIGAVLFCMLNLTNGPESVKVIVKEEFDRGFIVELKEYDSRHDRTFLVPKTSCNSWGA